MTETDIEDWIDRIKSDDAMTFEDAYSGNRPDGPEIVARLISEMHSAKDATTRGKFLELLGEMGGESVIPAIIPELHHTEQDVREWAVTALELIGGQVAQGAVAEYKAKHPEEFA